MQTVMLFAFILHILMRITVAVSITVRTEFIILDYWLFNGEENDFIKPLFIVW